MLPAGYVDADQRGDSHDRSSFMKSVDLAILNYKGRKHLEHLLPTALAEAERYIGTCRVVVVDNQSG